MIRKMMLGGGLLAALATTGVIGVPVWSYARTGMTSLRQSASDSMPIEWELKRARQMVTDLQPEIERAARQIALEKVQVARLEKQLSAGQEKLDRSERDIARLRNDLQSGNVAYTYAGRTYTSAQVKTDLGQRFKRHKTRAATNEKLTQMLDARRASLAAANQRLDAMLASRRQIEVEVENLQARLASLRVSQTASELSIDESQLSQTRSLLDDIAARIDVEEETIHVDAEYFGGINLEEPSRENLVDEIAAYFDGEQSTDESDDSGNGSLVSIQLD